MYCHLSRTFTLLRDFYSRCYIRNLPTDKSKDNRHCLSRKCTFHMQGSTRRALDTAESNECHDLNSTCMHETALHFFVQRSSCLWLHWADMIHTRRNFGYDDDDYGHRGGQSNGNTGSFLVGQIGRLRLAQCLNRVGVRDGRHGNTALIEKMCPNTLRRPYYK